MFSILLPIYNGIEYINDSVNSVINQTCTEWELLILVNGHPQNSDVFLEASKFSCDKIKVYDLFNIKGKSNALNYGIQYCKYDKVCLIDVDDLWLPTKLEKQLSVINKYDVVGTICIYFEGLNSIPYIPWGDVQKEVFNEINPIINSSVCINKTDAYWDPVYNCLEDYDMWLRLNSEGKTFFNFPEILVLHRIHKDSYFNTSNNQDNIKKELMEKYKK
jgi:teichuronic acid biosynthesis glycosyltransferase TuaG